MQGSAEVDPDGWELHRLRHWDWSALASCKILCGIFLASLRSEALICGTSKTGSWVRWRLIFELKAQCRGWQIQDVRMSDVYSFAVKTAPASSSNSNPKGLRHAPCVPHAKISSGVPLSDTRHLRLRTSRRGISSRRGSSRPCLEIRKSGCPVESLRQSYGTTTILSDSRQLHRLLGRAHPSFTTSTRHRI